MFYTFNSPLFLLICYMNFRGSRFTQCVILLTDLSIAHYQVSFYNNNYFE